VRSLVGSILTPRVTNLAGPPPYVGRSGSWFGRSMTDPGNMEQQAAAYGANGTLFGIVNRTSTATGAVGWGLYRKAASGKKEDRTPVTRHAALDLWNKPNKFFTQRLFVETEQQHVDLCGEGDWVISRSPRSRIPLELWPVQPHRITPVASREEYLAGWVYTGPDGEQVPLGIDEVIPIRMPNPNNLYRGLGPVQALMRTLDSQRYAEEWNRNFFTNNAEPGGIIEVEERLGDDEFNEFRDRWAESHQGISGAHRVAILENGMKWVERKYSMRDMQFAELAKVGDDKLFIAYGISKAMLGVTEDVNRANAEAGKAMFAEYLTVPRLDRFKDALNFQLLPMYGPTAADLEFDYDDPVPPNPETENADRDSRVRAVAALVPVGFDGEAAAKAYGLPDGLVWEKPEPPKPPMLPGQDSKTPAEPGNLSIPALLARLVNATSDQDDDLKQVQDEWEAALAALLAVWAGVTAAQRADLSEQVRRAVDAGDVAALAALTASAVQGTAVLAAALQAMAATAANTAAAEAAAQGVVAAPPGIMGGDLGVVAAAVAGLLAAGLATAAGREAVRLFYPGADSAEVAAGVDAHLAGLSDATLRAELGGALTRAQNVGRLEAFKAAEVVNPQVQYSASEVLDKNTCKPCKTIDGTNFPAWINAWEAYAGGSYRLCLGGVRCRGTVTATWIGGA
jgi:HK97 family phage portal protein